MMPRKHMAFALMALLALTGSASISGAEVSIPTVSNFAEIGDLSRRQRIPAVVFVTREACPYCRTLRESILRPMFAAGKFVDRAIVVELNLDEQEVLVGFNRQFVTARALGKFYQAEITPTLLFLNSQGTEISKRIVGISNLEFYGHYLQKSIDEALLKIEAGDRQDG